MRTRARAFFWLALPAVLLFLVFHTLPALQGVFYSFTDSHGYGDWGFVGFENYVRLFQDRLVQQSYGFTIGFSVVSTIAANVLSLAVALGLAANIRFRSFLRAIYFLPAILATLVVGYVFNYIFANVAPAVGQFLGLEMFSNNILGDPSLAWVGVVIVSVWQEMAMMTVIYMAGIQTVPEDVIEASRIDGANGWQRFWKVTFPLLAPFFTINMVLSLKSFLQVFDAVVALTEGGPGTSTMSIAMLIYRNGFQSGDFAYQSANAVIYFLIIAAISFVQLRYLQRREVSV